MQVLGRERWRGDEPPVRRLFDERVEEELRRALEDRVDRAQVGTIAGVVEAIPQRDRKPCASRWPDSPLRTVDRRGGAPQVGVVVRHPAAGAVHLPRRSRAGDRQVGHHRREGIHRLGQVRRQRRPVVHLGVDVDRVLAAPGRRQAVVPDALQVGRLRTRPGAGDEQVASVVEVERRQPWIAASGKLSHALVGGRGCRWSQIERDPVEQLLVVAHVRGAQRVEALAPGSVERCADAGAGISADVVEAAIARSGRDEQCDGVGPVDDDAATRAGAGTAGGDDADPCLEAQRAGHRPAVRRGAATVAVDAAHHQVAAAGGFDRGPLRRLQARLERDLPGPVGREPHHDHLIRRAREGLAREGDAARRVRQARGGGGEIQVAPITIHRLLLRKGESQVTQRLVRHLRQRFRHHLLADQHVRVAVTPGDEQAPDVRQRLPGLGVHGVVGAA